jgi:hypothetical protein
MSELAEARRAAGFGSGGGGGPVSRPAATPAPLARQSSVEAYEQALRNPRLTVAQREAIEAMKRRRVAKQAEAGISTPAARSSGSASPVQAGRGAGLARQFSSEMYDKMLRNPKLTPTQRGKIEAMKSRRVAKETGSSSSVSELVRTASPAAQEALRVAMSELAKAKQAEAGISTPAARSSGSAPPIQAGRGAGLARQFSSEMYDKMLRNPKLTPTQRGKIEAMKSRRVAKETVSSSSVSELVRTASPAAQEALRVAMSELAQAKKVTQLSSQGAPASAVPVAYAHHTPADGGLARTLSQLASTSGVSKAAIQEVMEILPTFTVRDLRQLYTGFRQYLQISEESSYLTHDAFAAVLSELSTDPVIGPLWQTKGFAFFEIMFDRFEYGPLVRHLCLLWYCARPQCADWDPAVILCDGLRVRV